MDTPPGSVHSQLWPAYDPANDLQSYSFKVDAAVYAPVLRWSENCAESLSLASPGSGTAYEPSV